MNLNQDGHDNLFFDGWNLYKKAVDNNCMFHTEMYHAFNNLLDTKFSNQAFSILDLGCGDSAYITKTLANKSVTNYTGVDLSEFATKLAQKNLPTTINKINFIHSDFIDSMQVMANNSQKFDVVFTSYALHHYSTAKKQEFFKLAKQLVTDNGIAVVIDIMLNEHEKLTEFYARLIKIYSSFDMLSHDDLNGYYQHISNSDFPETLNTYKDMTLNAGFRQFESLAEQKQMFQIFSCSL